MEDDDRADRLIDRLRHASEQDVAEEIPMHLRVLAQRLADVLPPVDDVDVDSVTGMPKAPAKPRLAIRIL